MFSGFLSWSFPALPLRALWLSASEVSLANVSGIIWVPGVTTEPMYRDMGRLEEII